MTSASLRSRIVVASALFTLLGFACGDSGHPLGQANGGSGGAPTGTDGGANGGSGGAPTGTGGGSAGSVATGGRGGAAGVTGTGGHAGNGGGGSPATGGSAGNGAGGAATGGAGGGAGHGGAGGTSTGGSGGQAGHGTGGAATGGQGGQATGGAGGAALCSSAPPVACPSNEVCDDDTPNRCSAGYEPGHCIVLPQSCSSTSAPVCGCNGTTYDNDCQRQLARAQLDHTGACTGGGGAGGQGGGAGGGTGACGGTDCAIGQVCVHPQCLNCSPQPAPFCADVPAGCSGTPTCSCLPFSVCQQTSQAAGACISVDSSGVHCG
jgi:hypothetical protein